VTARAMARSPFDELLTITGTLRSLSPTRYVALLSAAWDQLAEQLADGRTGAQLRAQFLARGTIGGGL
jgi:hypothetical protein